MDDMATDRDKLLSELANVESQIAAATSRAKRASSEQLFDDIVKAMRELQHERAANRAKLDELPPE